MPTKSVESRFVRRRKEGQQRGLCTVCLKRPAHKTLTVCLLCNDGAKQRVRESRKRKAEHERQYHTLTLHESAADLAANQYAYPTSLRHYDEALKCPALRPTDDARISQKIARALFFSHTPENAGGWYERALDTHRKLGIVGSNAVEAGALLLRLSRQYWLNAQTVTALSLIGEAIQLGTAARDHAFASRANLAMAHYLILLGRHEAAQPFFEAAGDVLQSTDPETRTVSLTQHAILQAAGGNKAEAYAEFEGAVEVAKGLTDGYWVTAIWDDYAIWALALGDIRTSQLCRQRALFVARDRHIAWRIAYLSLRYAHLLIELEEYDHARELVLDALTYGVATPCIVILLATVGLKLTTIGDAALSHRFDYEKAVDYAFQSGEPGRIGPMVSAVLRFYVERGRDREARKLLQRALNVLLSADHAWDLLFDAAAIGDEADQRKARRLLVSRAALPNGGVASAYVNLFDARLAKRRGSSEQQRKHALFAAESFENLGWRAQEHLARSYIDSHTKQSAQIPKTPRPVTFRTLLGDASKLTSREEEVAQLVLRGLTNRAIARELSISEHTVESHMTSIMNRLGIRSRHQLGDTLSVGGSRMTEPS